jgi:5'-3' exonuclease
MPWITFPGLPGVGEVTAKKFLKEFGSMENLLGKYAFTER